MKKQKETGAEKESKMSKQLEPHEAEAVLMLRGSNEAAWSTLMSYFSRRYNFARDKCVDTRDNVQLEQGKAKAFREIKDIEEDAQDVLESIRNE